MTVRLFIRCWLPALLLILTASCTKKEWQPALEGSMVGRVILFDEFGNQLNDNSGAKITAYGLDKNYVAYSDAEGRFELTGVPTGTYELHFEKAGFGTLIQTGIQHLGGQPTILGEGSSFFILIKKSTAQIKDLQLRGDTLLASVSWPGDSANSVLIQLFYSSREGFSIDSAEYAEIISFGKTGTIFKGFAFVSRNPFHSGSNVYFRAYAFTAVYGIYDGHQNYQCIYANNNISEPWPDYPNASQLSDQYEAVVP